jgi:hypothetical protein
LYFYEKVGVMTPTVKEEDSEGSFSQHAYAPSTADIKRSSSTLTPASPIEDWASHVPVGLFTITPKNSEQVQGITTLPQPPPPVVKDTDDNDAVEENLDNKVAKF